MNISVCITVFNEEDSIALLLDSLLNQTKKPDQIIIVDGGSEDKTVEIIRHYQQKDSRIKLLVEKCSRAKGRNYACEIAKSEIIAMTDAGCIADRDWIKNITAPFSKTKVDVVAGFYLMKAENSFETAESFFLGVTPGNFNVNFLPSTRSVAFKKEIWEKVGGFPEGLEGAAEDTIFNYKLIKAGAKFSRMKNATVEWGMPKNLKDFFNKIYGYAKGDAKSKIWFFPGKGPTSHNIKALSIILRYIAGMILLFLSIKYMFVFPILLILIFVYLAWSYRKLFLEFGKVRVSVWGPIIQVTSDVGVMRGFINGILGR